MLQDYPTHSAEGHAHRMMYCLGAGRESLLMVTGESVNSNNRVKKFFRVAVLVIINLSTVESIDKLPTCF